MTEVDSPEMQRKEISPWCCYTDIRENRTSSYAGQQHWRKKKKSFFGFAVKRTTGVAVCRLGALTWLFSRPPLGEAVKPEVVSVAHPPTRCGPSPVLPIVVHATKGELAFCFILIFPEKMGALPGFKNGCPAPSVETPMMLLRLPKQSPTSWFCHRKLKKKNTCQLHYFTIPFRKRWVSKDTLVLVQQ